MTLLGAFLCAFDAARRLAPLALVVSVAAIAAPPAFARTPVSPEVAKTMVDVEAAAEAGGVPAYREVAACSETCALLREAEQAAARSGEVGKAQRFAEQLWRLRAGAGRLLPTSLPELAPWTIARVAGSVGGAFATGYFIGWAGRKLFVEAPEPPLEGMIAGGVWRFTGDPLIETDGQVVVAPSMGLEAINEFGGSVTYTLVDRPCSQLPEWEPLPAAVDFPGWIAFGISRQCPWYPHHGSVSTSVFFHPTAPKPPVEWTDPVGDNPVVPFPNYDAAAAHLSPEEIKDAIQDALEEHPDEFDVARKFFNFNLRVPGAADPFSNHFNMPDCRHMTATACTTRLEELAGSSTNITTRTLPASDAVMEEDPGKVTDTGPTSGVEVAPGGDLDVYTNPATMPTMTPTEIEIADTLAEDNPGTINDTNKRTIARACLKRATTPLSGTSSSDCTARPVFFTGSDAQEAAEHDIEAMVTHPQWAALNKRTIGDNSRWYRNKPGCLTVDKSGNQACDEYPLWSTMQGKDGLLSFGIDPDIKWIDFDENSRQGTLFGQFTSGRGSGRAGLPPGCVIQADDPLDWFLMVPLPPGTPIKTTWACNGRWPAGNP